jgi:hypothetical protein
MDDRDLSAECCPEFDPLPWQETRHDWQGKLFIKDTVPQFFHIPLPSMFGKRVVKMMNQAKAAGADLEPKEMLLLTHDPSPWKAELYMAVKSEVPGIENAQISGSFLTKVYDGPYNAVPKWIKDMNAYVAGQGKKVGKYYFHFAYCPKCSKKYGHNYVVAFAKVGE